MKLTLNELDIIIEESTKTNKPVGDLIELRTSMLRDENRKLSDAYDHVRSELDMMTALDDEASSVRYRLQVENQLLRKALKEVVFTLEGGHVFDWKKAQDIARSALLKGNK